MCEHVPNCPAADGPDRHAARLVVFYPAQGWGLLCNGVVLFDDTGEILPDGQVIAPHRACGPPSVPAARPHPPGDAAGATPGPPSAPALADPTASATGLDSAAPFFPFGTPSRAEFQAPD
jgi:Family of unknown function (DUF5999)